MPTPANATAEAVKGQLFNFSGVITSITTQNAITGGLTALAGQISKDDGAFTATANSPVEIGTSGTWSLDLTLTEMTATKVVIVVTASNVGAVYSYIQINPLDLAGTYTDLYNALSVLKSEQMQKNIWQYLFNENNQVDQTGAVYNDVGGVLGTYQMIPAENGVQKGQTT